MAHHSGTRPVQLAAAAGAAPGVRELTGALPDGAIYKEQDSS